MGAKCDRCGNFDEAHRKEMDYPLYDDHCIQDYQPEMYTIGIPRWRRITIGEMRYRTQIAYVKSVLTI